MLKLFKKLFSKHLNTINDYFWRFLQIFVKQGTSFLIFYLSSYFLNDIDFGKYNYLMATIFLLSSFCDFGVSVSVHNQVVEVQHKEKIKLKELIFNSLITVSLLSTLFSIIILFTWNNFFIDFSKYKLLVILLIYFIPISSVLDGIYRGLKKFKLLSIVVVFSSLISLISFYFLVSSFGIYGSILSQLILYLVISILLFIFNGKLEHRFSFSHIKNILNYALVIGIGSVAYFLYSRIDIFFLGKFNYFVEISYFEIISKIHGIILLPIYIFAQVISPNIVNYSYNNDYRSLLNKLKKFLIYSLIISVFIVIISILSIKPFISLFFAKYYANEFFTIFYILTFVLWVSVVNGIFPQAFIASTGDYDIVSKMLFIFGIMNVILDYLFIKRFGALGIAYSTLIVVGLSNLLMIIFYYLRLVKKYENKKL